MRCFGESCSTANCHDESLGMGASLRQSVGFLGVLRVLRAGGNVGRIVSGRGFGPSQARFASHGRTKDPFRHNWQGCERLLAKWGNSLGQLEVTSPLGRLSVLRKCSFDAVLCARVRQALYGSWKQKPCQLYTGDASLDGSICFADFSKTLALWFVSRRLRRLAFGCLEERVVC